jgi:hypothetical protein
VVPSGVSVYGLTDNFNAPGSGGVQMVPSGSAEFVVEGNAPAYFANSTIANLTFSLANTTSAASAIYINQVYHLTLDHIAIYSGQNAQTAALDIASVNDLICNYCVVWGNQTTPSGYGIIVNGGGPAVIQFNSPDIEGFAYGMTTSGVAEITMVEPWFESNNTGYVHGIQTGLGSGRILGGQFAANGTGIEVTGDQLLVQGTLFTIPSNSYGMSLPQSYYTDIELIGVPTITASNMFAAGANFMGVKMDPPRISHMVTSKISFAGIVTSGTATNILSLNSFAIFGRFRLILTAFGGAGFQTNQYDFGITGNTITGSVVVTPLSQFSNSNWTLALSQFTFTVNGSNILVGVTATESGTLGHGNNPMIIGELEALNFENGGVGNSSSSGAINILLTPPQ